MHNKIEWYKEVLELEPSSRVFFPLARMLADNGKHADALGVLRQGLDRHPEHFEATLLLMEVLKVLGRTEELNQVVRELADKMAGYPSFFDAWAMAMAGEEGSRDSALALSFLASRFQGEDLSWSDVIEQGLKAMAKGAAGDETPARRREGLSVVQPLRDVAKSITQEAKTAGGRSTESAADADLDEAGAEALEFVADEAMDAAAQAVDRDADVDEDVENEEPISYRTRTMADLLAEQGDVQGALEIYQEILDRLPPGPQRDEVRARMEALAEPQEAEPKAEPQPAEAGSKEGAPRALTGKSKLIETLENLAQRLEVRAAG